VSAHPIIVELLVLRERKGWSQRRASDESGISHGLISHWERGDRQPLFEGIVRYANALGYELILVPKEDNGSE